jgi:predicted hydrolase (HD superfamily)
MRVTGFESTPNPNAIKCVVAGSVSEAVVSNAHAIRSYRSAAEAGADTLAVALFGIDGVANILIAAGWITVGKNADAEWKSMKPKIKRVIESHTDGVVRGS